jgi:hypothetical protein
MGSNRINTVHDLPLGEVRLSELERRVEGLTNSGAFFLRLVA